MRAMQDGAEALSVGTKKRRARGPTDTIRVENLWEAGLNQRKFTVRSGGAIRSIVGGWSCSSEGGET